jgi:hypothetical protein
LVNDEDQEVARLDENDHGEPFLRFEIARNEGMVLVGGLGEDLAGVAIVGKDSRMTVATDKTGSPALGISSGDRKAILGIKEDGSPTLLMIHGAANLAATAAPPRIRLKDETQTTILGSRDPAR